MADALVFAFPILILCVPRGAGVFLAGVGILLLLGWRGLGREWRHHARVLVPLTLSVLAFLAVYLASKFYHHTPWNVIDNPSRALLSVFTCWMIVRTAPNPDRLWDGITVGLVGALGIVLFQYFVEGNGRPSAWVQPIAFANMVAALTLVGFVRPGDSHRSDAMAWINVLCALPILGMNETRGAMMAMLITMFPLLLVRYRRFGFRMFLASAAGIVVLVIGLYMVPGSPVAKRVDQAVSEATRFFELGKVETSVGARLKMWQLGTDYFVEHPLMGAGVGQFAHILQASPYCKDQALRTDGEEKQVVCVLEHAHNDIVEAASTTGLPGLLTLLGLFLVPAAIFASVMRVCRDRQNYRGISLAGAGLGVVMATLISGLTQVTLAHQANVVFYAGLIGLLLGFASCEARASQPSQRPREIQPDGVTIGRVRV